MTRIIAFTETTDPDAVDDTAILYSKDDGGGVTKLYARLSDGTIVELGAAGGGGGNPIRVFRPGSGLSGPVVFDDFNGLYETLGDALTAGGGQCTVFIDDSDESPAVLDSGEGDVEYDFTGVKLVGIHPHNQTPLDVTDGGGETDSLTITGASYFENLHVRATGQDTGFDGQDDQTVTLNNTTFEGAGEYVYDFINVSGCILHLGDESRLQRSSNAAIRVNNQALTIHVDGARAVIDNLGISGFVGGSINVIIGSASARVDKQQDILSTAFTMSVAAGFWNGNPNGVLTATEGTLVSDENTGTVWKNTDGGTTWATFGGGVGSTLLIADEGTNIPNTPHTRLDFAGAGVAVTDAGGGTALVTIPGGGLTFDTSLAFETPSAMAVSPDGSRLYVCNTSGDNVAVFDASDNSYVATIAVGSQPAAIVFTPNGQWVYVATVGDGAVSVIDSATNTVAATIPGVFTNKMIASPGNTHIYALNPSGSVLNVIEVSSNTIVASPVVGLTPADMAMLPDGSYVCVVNYDSNDVTVIETTTFTVDTTIPLANFNPASVAAAPDNGHIYVGTLDNFITKIETTGWTVVGSPLAGQPFLLPMGLLIDSTNTRLYVRSDGFRFYWIELAEFTVDGQGPDMYPSLIKKMVLSPDGAHIYASHTDDVTGQVVVVETSNPTAIYDAPVVGTSPGVLVSTLDSSTVFVSDEADNTVHVITALGTNVVLLNPGGVSQGPFDTLQLLPSAVIVDLGGGKASVDIFQLVGPGSGENSAVLNNNTGNDASGVSAVSLGNGAIASGDESFATGSGTEAQGVASFAEGNGTIAKGDYAHAEGDGAVANGPGSHAEGIGTTAEFDAEGGHAEGFETYASNGEGAHAEGHQTQASGRGAHAEGASTQASGTGSHAEGVFTAVYNRAGHAEGESTSAVGEKAHAEGDNTWAQGWASHSEGLDSYARGDGERAHASGPGTTATGLQGVQGGSQTTVKQMTAETPGLESGESVELDFGYITSSNKFTFGTPLDNMVYTIVVTAAARGDIGGFFHAQSFRQTFCVMVLNGVATLEGVGAQEQMGSVAASSWTLVGDIATSPDRFRLTFTTGTTTANVRVSAKVEAVEIHLPAPPAPAISSFSSFSGYEGDTISIFGSGFTTATDVEFNGVPATTFNIIDDTEIQAEVPATTTGPVTVTSPTGIGTSPSDFTYQPWIALTSVPVNRFAKWTIPIDSGNKVLYFAGSSNISPLNHGPNAADVDCYIYDVALDSWSLTGAMGSRRSAPVACLLANGNVLVGGGYNLGVGQTTTAEVYDVGAGTWSPTANNMIGAPDSPRIGGTMTLLDDDTVLVMGGTNGGTTYQIYDPGTNTFGAPSNLPVNYVAHGHHCIKLPGGDVLAFEVQVSGAFGGVLRYSGGVWSTRATGAALMGAGFALLPSGKILRVGGMASTIYFGNAPPYPISATYPAGSLTCDIYDPVADSWTAAAPLPAGPRIMPIVKTLGDGSVLCVSGFTTSGMQTTTYLYDEGTDTWTLTSSSPSPGFAAPIPYTVGRDQSVDVGDGLLILGGASPLGASLGSSVWKYRY
jgi:YVTN family beta-propeller protein